jgi:hypothetical protein
METMKSGISAKLIMPGLVPGIHVLAALKQERRGWPGHLREDALRAFARP